MGRAAYSQREELAAFGIAHCLLEIVQIPEKIEIISNPAQVSKIITLMVLTALGLH
jgi:hypothetical protein